VQVEFESPRGGGLASAGPAPPISWEDRGPAKALAARVEQHNAVPARACSGGVLHLPP